MVDPTIIYTLDTLVVDALSFVLGLLIMRSMLGFWPFKGCFESKPSAGEVWKYKDIYYYIHAFDGSRIKYSYITFNKEFPSSYHIHSTFHYATWLQFVFSRSKFAKNIDQFRIYCILAYQSNQSNQSNP